MWRFVWQRNSCRETRTAIAKRWHSYRRTFNILCICVIKLGFCSKLSAVYCVPLYSYTWLLLFFLFTTRKLKGDCSNSCLLLCGIYVGSFYVTVLNLLKTSVSLDVKEGFLCVFVLLSFLWKYFGENINRSILKSK